MSQTFKPHDYQLDIVQFICDNPRCAVWAGMGTGKTASTLLALEALSAVEDIFPVLVLAPLRVAKTTWPDEVAKWSNFSHLRVVNISGDIKARERAIKKPADIYTTNYENLIWLKNECIDKWPFKTVVADEFTRLKSFRLRQGSIRARALAHFAHTDVSRFIGLTGTPSPNGLSDLWGQTWFLDRGARLGRTYGAFESRWFTKGWDGYSIEPTASAQQQIENMLRDICLTVKGLPVDEPVSNVIEVNLPAAARKLYDEMEREMFIEIEEQGVEALNSAARTTKLLQIANGAAYVGENHEWVELHNGKLEALESVIEEASGAPVLVAYHFKSDLHRLRKAFPQGKVLDTDPQTIHDWNEGKIPLLFAHPASAGHGLNLAKGGNILCFFGLNWNLEEHMQIIERIGPMRQKQAGLDRPVFIHYLTAKDTVDTMILQRLQTKKSMQEILLEAMDRRREKVAA